MMRRVVFDTETDGLLKETTKVHCIGIMDADTGESRLFTPDNIQEALPILYEADELIGHNIIGFDLPVLKKVFGWNFRPGCKRTDTLVTARLLHSDITKDDAARPGFPGKLVGSHSLRAWGVRLGELKGDYGYDDKGKAIPGAWDKYTPEMGEYMMGDVRVTLRLLNYLRPWEQPQVPFELEHRYAEICFQMEQDGWPFDVAGAQALYVRLAQRRDELETQLKEAFPPWQEVERILVPKRDNSKRGYVKGVPVTIYRTVVYNPGSRVHTEKKLRELGWEPEDFTEGGRAKLDEPILLKIDIPEAKLIIEYLIIQKRLGQLADGDNGWLRVVGEDGNIHGSYISIGTVHHRAAHSKPNLGQVPNAYSPYGSECRALFGVPPGWKLVGADMSGAQLRCLAHWMYHFDNGKYADIVVNGDIHTYHMESAAPYIPSRDQSKTTIYAKLFGAAAPKIGSINGGNRAVGQKILDLLSTKIPGLGALEKAVKAGCAKGWLKSLDGRRIPVSSDRLGLNYLVTSTEAILCKTWLVDFYDTACLRFKPGWDGDFVIVGHIHDEVDVAVREGLEDVIGGMLTKTAMNAGLSYKFKVPLKSDYKVGNSWKDVH
ncbi:MAG: DNA polymerase [Thiothrix sp.]|uniref:DNA polymerase n=1 Tax=Thiothrix sp. TaxID=1032 RepID=UPI002606B937|nr:DNA polymerase [Thiothrix sp.]MDD5395280.1 DNA polymerase [Thiothrix sp.]